MKAMNFLARIAFLLLAVGVINAPLVVIMELLNVELGMQIAIVSMIGLIIGHEGAHFFDDFGWLK